MESSVIQCSWNLWGGMREERQAGAATGGLPGDLGENCSAVLLAVEALEGF